jgi:CTP synthase (UTP-ammonia lyase)
MRVGVVGDYRPDKETHVATNAAIEHAAPGTDTMWIPTTDVDDSVLAACDAIFVSPGSPYASLDGALRAIAYARRNDVPLIGTCGGFQHIVIEFARNVAGMTGATHAEYEPDGAVLLVDQLECSLAGQSMEVSLVPGSAAHRAYGTNAATERYYCTFGLNPSYVQRLVDAGLSISGTDQDGEPRIVELPGNRFFVGTLFVPQASSRPGRPHPLVTAFLQAASLVSR